MDKNISSKIVYLLLLLLKQHPNMKLIIIKETEQLLFRNNVLERAQYYTITFLNQIVLSNKEHDVFVANKLIDIYFRLFDDLVKKVRGKKDEVVKVDKGRWKKLENGQKGKGKSKNKPTPTKEVKDMIVDGVDAKIMTGLLTGVNRAIPFAKLDSEK